MPQEIAPKLRIKTLTSKEIHDFSLNMVQTNDKFAFACSRPDDANDSISKSLSQLDHSTDN